MTTLSNEMDIERHIEVLTTKIRTAKAKADVLLRSAVGLTATENGLYRDIVELEPSVTFAIKVLERLPKIVDITGTHLASEIIKELTNEQ